MCLSQVRTYHSAAVAVALRRISHILLLNESVQCDDETQACLLHNERQSMINKATYPYGATQHMRQPYTIEQWFTHTQTNTSINTDTLQCMRKICYKLKMREIYGKRLYGRRQNLTRPLRVHWTQTNRSDWVKLSFSHWIELNSTGITIINRRQRSRVKHSAYFMCLIQQTSPFIFYAPRKCDNIFKLNLFWLKTGTLCCIFRSSKSSKANLNKFIRVNFFENEFYLRIKFVCNFHFSQCLAMELHQEVLCLSFQTTRL